MFKFKNPVISIRCDLKSQMVRIGYIHPTEPHEDLCFEICREDYDINILRDFLSAYFPMADFKNLTDTQAKKFCQEIYESIVQGLLKQASDKLLAKAAALCAANRT